MIFSGTMCALSVHNINDISRWDNRMKKTNTLLVLTWLQLGSLSTAAAASVPASLAIMPIDAIGLSRTEARTLRVVVGQSVQQVANTWLAETRDIDPLWEEHGDAPSVGRALGVDATLVVTAIRLERRILLNALLWIREDDERRVVRVESRGMDDMDIVTERVMAALLHKIPFTQTAGLNNVVAKEASAPKRKRKEVDVAPVLGTRLPLVQNASYFPLADMAMEIWIQHDSYFLLISGHILVPVSGSSDSNSYGGVGLELGGAAYLMDAVTSLYVGGSVEMGLLAGTGGAVKLAPKVFTGLALMRNSDAKMFVEFSVAQHVFPFELASNKYYPTELGFSMGIQF
jgi:hypothetical protein